MDDKTATSEYIIIPKSILTDTRLCKPNITEFYGVILSLSRQTGYCFASNSYLADFMRCDVHTVTRWVTRLKQLGYIRAEYLKGDSSNNITERKIYPTVWVLTDLSVPTNSNAEGVLTDLRGGYGQIGTEGTNPNAEYNNKLIIRDTPKVFRDVGFNPLPFTINQTHVDYALNGSKDIDHAIGEAMLKQLPESLDNPVAIIKSKLEDSNRVVALLDFVHNGKNVVTPVEIDGYGRQNNIIIDSNAITSIYGKNNLATGLLSDALNEEQSGNTAVFYLDNKKATALLQKAGLRLPRVLFRNDGYIHSIREQGLDVKPKFENVTYTQQFKRWFGDWENNPHTASKVVNADGTP